MSSVTVSNAEEILCFSSTMFVGRGGRRKPNLLHSRKEKNRKGSSQVIAGGIIARHYHHFQHVQSIFLADFYSGKVVLKVSSDVEHRLSEK